MIVKDCEVIFENGYGLADVEKNIPITAETYFRFASVTIQSKIIEPNNQKKHNYINIFT